MCFINMVSIELDILWYFDITDGNITMIWMGKLTISIAIFNSYVSHYQRVHGIHWNSIETYTGCWLNHAKNLSEEYDSEKNFIKNMRKRQLGWRNKIPGWWLTYPSEKYESIGMTTFPRVMEKSSSHVPEKPPTITISITINPLFIHHYTTIIHYTSL